MSPDFPKMLANVSLAVVVIASPGAVHMLDHPEPAPPPRIDQIEPAEMPHCHESSSHFVETWLLSPAMVQSTTNYGEGWSTATFHLEL